MTRWLRFVVTLLVGVSYWSMPLGSQTEATIQYSLQSESQLAGVLVDPVNNRPISFKAVNENDVLTVRLDLDGQSVTVRNGQGELHVDSSRNRSRQFSTLSDGDRLVLRRLVAQIGTQFKAPTAFQASVLCTMTNLSAWPAAMPLSVSIDSVMKTVGDVSVSIAEIQEARRRAMEELSTRTPGGLEPPVVAESIATLCNQIGTKQAACYPTSIAPYREKCEKILVGGTDCTGRCGSTCNGICDGQKYTQDCHSHDRCADVFGLTHRFCNYMFADASDDCKKGLNCVDSPGVWTLIFNWKGYKPGNSGMNVHASRKFSLKDGSAGTWTGTATTLTLNFVNGCKPVYSGTLSGDRLLATGTMKCRTGSGSGTWRATKTNGALAASLPASTDRLTSAPDRRAGDAPSASEPN